MQIKTIYRYKNPTANEDGSALVIVLLFLVLMTVIGLSSNKTTGVEIKIAANDKAYKQTFYEADGGTEVARELLEQNLSCPGGFPNDDYYIEYGDSSAFLKVGTKDFYLNVDDSTSDYSISDTNWDFYYPDNDDTDNTEDFSDSHTKVVVYGNTELSEGNALQMIAGYEGKGKSAAGGGAQIVYNLASMHEGMQNSKVTIMINYRHIIGLEGNCNY